MAIKVLVVDDSVTIRTMLEQVISSDPECQVVGIAASAELAHRMIDDTRPDVITLDLSMPEVCGMTFLQRLGRLHPPVLVLSSSTTKGSSLAAEAVENGASDCFDKAHLLSETRRFLRALKQIARAPRCITSGNQTATRANVAPALAAYSAM